MTARASLNAIAYSYFIAALLDGPKTRAELAAASGLSMNLCSRLIDALRKRSAMHVASWSPDPRGYLTIRCYALGRGTDMPCPSKPRAEVVRDWADRRRTNKGAGR